MPTTIPHYELLRALRYADVPTALNWLQGHPASQSYADAWALLHDYSQTLGVTGVDVARLAELLRDMLSGYPLVRWAIPCAICYRSRARWVPLPILDSRYTPTGILSARWLPLRDAMARLPNLTAQIHTGRPQVALLVIETAECADAPRLELPEHQRWLANQFDDIPAGDSVRLSPGSPAGLSLPEAIEAGLVLQAQISNTASAPEPARYFLSDSSYFAVLKARTSQARATAR